MIPLLLKTWQLTALDKVTKEEAVWESFSEDEPAPKKPKLPSATSKGKKGGAKQGQGNIMSFFSKK